MRRIFPSHRVSAVVPGELNLPHDLRKLRADRRRQHFLPTEIFKRRDIHRMQLEREPEVVALYHRSGDSAWDAAPHDVEKWFGPARDAQAQEDVALEALHLAVGDEEDISRAAGRIEHAETAQRGERLTQFADGFSRPLDPLAPRTDDGGSTTFWKSNSLVKCAPNACRSLASMLA